MPYTTSGDLNQDGYADIVFANSTDGSTANVDSYIYWGSGEGYSPANRSGLPVQRAVGVSAIDLNPIRFIPCHLRAGRGQRRSENASLAK